jgi:Domain of unknown function (DUF1707)
MARPDDERAPGAGGRGRLRAGDADREQALEVLKAAFVQGRLAKAEFDVRVGRVLAARTYADLAPATAGLPAGGAAVRPERAPARKPVDKVRVAAWGASAGVALAALGVVAAVVAGSHGFFYVFALAFILATGLAYAFVAEAWIQARSRGPRPPGPAPDAAARVSGRPGPAAEAGQLPRADRGPRPGAEVTRGRRSRSRRPGSRAARQRHPRGRGHATGCAGQ